MKLSLSCSGSDHGTAPPPQAGDSAKTKAIIHAHILTFSIWILDMWATHAITHKYAKKNTNPMGFKRVKRLLHIKDLNSNFFVLYTIVYECRYV